MTTKRDTYRKLIASLGITAALMAVLLGAAHPSRAATITVAAGVVDIASDGQCSLAEAIENANDDAATHADCPAGSGADTIELAGGAIYEIITGSGTGLPGFSDELTINGHNATIRKNNPASYRLMNNYPGNILVINNLILEDGGALSGGGGAIFNSGHLTVRHSTFTSNYAQDDGGAIYVNVNNSGTSLTVNNSTFENNGAVGDGGAIYMDLDGSETSLLINNSTFTGNDAGPQGGAIHGNGSNWRFEVRGSTFTDNTANTGGAIYFYNNPANGTIAHSTFSNNEAQTGGGGAIIARTDPATPFTFDHLTMNNNVAATGGGAMVLGDLGFGNFQVQFSTFDGNEGNYGGAISAGNDFTLTQVAMIGNSANEEGGAIDIRSVATVDVVGKIEYSEISGNTAGANGGGINLEPGDELTLRHSTVSGNDATSHGGGIANTGTMSVSYATVVNNDAGGQGGGFWNPSGGDMIMRNTAVLNNTSVTVGYSSCSNSGTFDSRGYNRYPGSAISGCSSLFTEGTDAFISQAADHIDLTLADNGGFTQTHDIVQNGDLHNQIPDATNACQAGSSLDQRGHIRANGTGSGGSECDIGAFEYASDCATPSAPDVAIAISGVDDVALSWTQPAENFSTEIWRSSNPYFDPTIPGSRVPYITLGEDYLFAEQLGNVNLNRFYAVRGVAGCGGVSADVDFVGEFDFALTPGI